MPEPTDPAEAKRHFLDVEDAEIVHGPDVIAAKVSGALKDADRFDVPQVKPPLSDALNRVAQVGIEAAGGEPTGQDALSASAAGVDEKAGSAAVLKPAGTTDPA